MTFDYSLGRNKFDNKPAQCSAETLHDFARDVLRHRARNKANAGFVCARFGDDGHRRAANALPCSWLPLDVDGIDPGVFVEWRLHCTRYRGFGWPTARSTPEAPRERVIIELSEPVDRAQGIGLGSLIMRDVAKNFGTSVRIDKCTFRADQPCYLPLVGAEPFFLLGDPLDVPTWIAQAPPAPPPPPPLTAEVALLADARMRWFVGVLGQHGYLRSLLPNERGYAMRCPWEPEHTSPDAPNSTATVLLFPSEANGWRGGFKCLHTHCEHRGLRDLDDVLRRATQKVGAA